MAWLSHGGVSQLAMRLKEPVSFAWDFPDGPLQQLVASVIGGACSRKPKGKSAGRCSRFSTTAARPWRASALCRARRGCRRRPRPGRAMPTPSRRAAAGCGREIDEVPRARDAGGLSPRLQESRTGGAGKMRTVVRTSSSVKTPPGVIRTFSGRRPGSETLDTSWSCWARRSHRR